IFTLRSLATSSNIADCFIKQSIKALSASLPLPILFISSLLSAVHMESVIRFSAGPGTRSACENDFCTNKREKAIRKNKVFFMIRVVILNQIAKCHKYLNFLLALSYNLFSLE